MPRSNAKKGIIRKNDYEKEEEKKTDELFLLNTVLSEEGDDGTEEDLAGKPDGMGGLPSSSTHIAFEVGYATTSRSTCKRCDVRIMQGEIRVASRPLFRGKPGYTIYKHLACTVFPTDIICAEDVPGYDDLDMQDYDTLRQRIVESVTEIQLETQELEPEELVQKEFRGRIRSLPPGLNATLLPFQKEGMSWMYCQEVGTTMTLMDNTEEEETPQQDNTVAEQDDIKTKNRNLTRPWSETTPRVGLLSDEMGMVRRRTYIHTNLLLISSLVISLMAVSVFLFFFQISYQGENFTNDITYFRSSTTTSTHGSICKTSSRFYPRI